MSRLSLAIGFGISFVLAMPAAAVEEHHPADKPGVKPPAAAQPALAPAQAEQRMQRMLENVMRVHELMHKVQQVQDPKERERLVQEMRAAMQENMHLMQEMMGGGMMGSGMMPHMHPMHHDGGKSHAPAPSAK